MSWIGCVNVTNLFTEDKKLQKIWFDKKKKKTKVWQVTNLNIKWESEKQLTLKKKLLEEGN